MANAIDLLTLAEGKEAVNLPASTSSQDDRLAQYITGISRRVDNLCGNVVQRTVTGEKHDGGGRVRILLFEHYAQAISSFVEYSNITETTLTAETNASKPANSYLLVNEEPYSFVYRRSSNSDKVFPKGRQNLVVTYLSGRAADTASVSEDFKLAAASVLRRVFKRESSSWSQTPQFFPDTENPSPQLTFFKAVDPMLRELLASELLPPVGVGS